MNLYVKTPNNEIQCLSRDYEAGSQVLSFDAFVRLMIGFIDYLAEKQAAEEERNKQ